MDEILVTDVHEEGPARELRAHVIAFNCDATGYNDGLSLGCFVRDDDGRLTAGLNGFTWGAYAMIEWLWVARDRRHRGVGRQLMDAAEREARRRGCGVVRVNTHSFQAPGFYLKLGYDVVGRAEHTPAGHAELFFAKRL